MIFLLMKFTKTFSFPTLILFMLLCFSSFESQAQLYTGNSIQLGGYTGAISIGKPLPLYGRNTNLFIERNSAGTALFVGNDDPSNTTTAITAYAPHSKSIEAFTNTGYAIHARNLDPAGYAGYFQGQTYVSDLTIGNEIASPYVIAGNFSRSATALSVRANDSFPHDVANFQVGTNRLFIVGKSESGGYNPLTQADDVALFFSDGLNNGGSNLAGGFTLAPFRHGNPGSGFGYGLHMNADGQIGIGVKNPTHSLDVHGSISADGDAFLAGDTHLDDLVYDINGSGLNFQARDMQAHTSAPKRLRMRLTPDGRLGLGAANPISPFEIRFDGNSMNTRSAISLVAVDPSNEASKISFRTPAGEKMALGTDPDGNGEFVFYLQNGQLNNRAITVRAADNATRILGDVAIGSQTIPGRDRLSVDGTIASQGVRVTMKGWHDYVFEDAYVLPPLSEVESYIEEEGHLPDIPSEAEVVAEGLDLGEMQGLLLKKIEELTLYVIQLEKEVDTLQSQSNNENE
ncbi:MAG: hypothetical protein AB8F95_02390 [Bacteroidia bacterium]